MTIDEACKLRHGFYLATCSANGTRCRRIVEKLDDDPTSDWRLWSSVQHLSGCDFVKAKIEVEGEGWQPT